MTRRCLLSFLGVCAFLTNQGAFAANAWTGPKTIAQVQVVEDGGFLLTFSTPVGPQCSLAGPSTLYIYPGAHYVTADGAKAMLAIALTALTTGMKVDVMYDDSTSACYGRYVRIAP